MEFGKYRLVRKLATGGMAEIFLARQEGMEGFEKTLVIKRILPIHADNAELIDMFLDEARIAATLNHPNIVQIFDLGKCDDEYFIAMEHIHGQDLRRICERGLAVGNFLPLRHAVRIIADGAAGLHYAHNQLDSAGEPLNIVHRDISPQNIVVSFDGVVKILDFGIAKAANKIVTTRHGQLKGKYAYMSPEQCNGLEVDQRSDIFSLGTLLYEITVCTRLFKGDTDIQTIKRVSEAVVPLPSEVRPGFPVGLEQIILKALAKDPHDRYQSGRQFQEDLEDFLSQNRMKTGPVQLGNYMREIFPDKLEMPDADPDLARKEARKPGRKVPMATSPEPTPAPQITAAADEQTNLMPPDPEPTPAVVVPAPEVRAPETVQLPEIQARPPLEDPNRVPPSVVETDPGLPPSPNPRRHAPRPAPEAHPEPQGTGPGASGEHVSFVVSPNAPFNTGNVQEFKKKQRKVSRSSVKTVEYQLRSEDDEELDSFERGSRFYYWILALVVLPMLGFGAFLLYNQGTFFASSDTFSHTGPGDQPDVGVEAPPPPLETVLLNLTTDPPGAAVVINGVLQSGETPGDFNVVPGTVNTVSLYAKGHYPRHKNEEIPATGVPPALHLNLPAVELEGEATEIPTSKLTISSVPDGASVLINGRDAGLTPLEASVLTGVEHHVTLRKSDHQDFVALVYAWPEDLARIDATLVPNSRTAASRFTELTIESRDASITIDGDSAGVSPHFSNRDRNELYRVELRRKEHHPYRRVIASTVGSIYLSPALRKIVKEPGTLTVKLVPKDIQIYIGTTEYEAKELKKLELQSGKYPVVLVRPGDPEVRGEVELEVEARALSAYEIDFTGDKPSVRRTK